MPQTTPKIKPLISYYIPSINICQFCNKGFTVVCKSKKAKFCPECRRLKWKLWKKTRNWENSDAGKLYMKNKQKEYTRIYKKQVYDHYGWRCNCCGEVLVSMLTLDHVNNDGYLERENIVKLYKRIIKSNFPDSYQILCMNCNWSKRINYGFCEHKL